MELDNTYTYRLEERTIKIAPVIDFLPEEEAIIVVNISVDEFGNVVNTDWDFYKTKGDWITILNKVLKAVSEVKFNTITSKKNSGINHYTKEDYLSNPEPEYQEGKMTFIFFATE